MLKNNGLRVFLSISLMAGIPLCAQSVISAKAGMVHYIDGDVYINDKPIEMKTSVYTDIVGEKETLRTGEEGRAEVLLTPGVFLRLAEASSFKMVSNKLSDTKVELLSGTALLEVAEILKDNAITLVYKNETIAVQKKGLYRVDADKGMLRVYDGEAVVSRDGSTYTVKQSKFLNLDASVLTAEKFDSKIGDEFYRWASRRASYLSMANIASAKQMYDSGYSGGYGYTGGGAGSWVFNQYYGMMTYMPVNGYYTSPFGYGFYSPGQVFGALYPGYGYGYGSGYNNGYTGAGGGGVSSGTRYDSSVGYNVGSRSAGVPVSSGGGSSVGSVGGGASAGASAGSARGGGGSSGGGGGTSSGSGRGR